MVGYSISEHRPSSVLHANGIKDTYINLHTYPMYIFDSGGNDNLQIYIHVQKRRLQKFFAAAGKYLPSCYLATTGGYTDRPTDSPLIGHGPDRK
jgi:hypothetical protein